MRELKFKYYWQHDDTGVIISKIFTLKEIENGIVLLYMKSIPRYGEPISRNQWTGYKDKNGTEIYHEDIFNDFYLNDRTVNEWTVACWMTDEDKMNMPMNYVEIIGNSYENKEIKND